MTMEEIDRRRGCADAAIERRRKVREASSTRWGDARRMLESEVERCEADVLMALREWWNQGCREDPIGRLKDEIIAGLNAAEREVLAERFKK